MNQRVLRTAAAFTDPRGIIPCPNSAKKLLRTAFFINFKAPDGRPCGWAQMRILSSPCDAMQAFQALAQKDSCMHCICCQRQGQAGFMLSSFSVLCQLLKIQKDLKMCARHKTIIIWHSAYDSSKQTGNVIYLHLMLRLNAVGQAC